MTARSPAGSNSRRPAGSAATRCGCTGSSTGPRLPGPEKGVTIDGIAYGSIRAQLERQQGSNAWIAFALREGKNREVRRVLEHLGYPVTRLIRLSYGPLQLGHLARGDIEEVQKKVLEDQLGKGDGPDSAPQRRKAGRDRKAKEPVNS